MMRWEKLSQDDWNALLESNHVYDDTDLLMQAQIKAWAAMAVALGCAKDYGIDLSEYIRQFGERFARSWQIFRRKPVDQVMQWFLFNVEAVGFDVLCRELNADISRARISQLTDGMKKILELEGVTPEEGFLLHSMWLPIAESIEMTFTYYIDGNDIIYELKDGK